jgi:hypothetical protein
MAIGVRLLVSTTGRRPTGVIGILGVAGTGWARIFISGPAPISIPIASVIELTRGSTAAVIIATRAVATRRAAAVIVVVVRGRRVAATSSGRARTIPIASAVVGPTGAIRGARLERRRWRRVADFGDADDLLALELAAVKLLDGRLEVFSSLVFNKAARCQWLHFRAGRQYAHPVPSRSRPTSL